MAKKYDDDALESIFSSTSAQTQPMGGPTNLGTARAGPSTHSHKSPPTLAFIYNGMEYWGSPHSGLDDFPFEERDLIVNAFGVEYTPRPFIKSAPGWFALEDVPTEPSQIVFDWKDFSVPPQSINIDFWESLIEQSHAEGIRRIIVCCGAGLGRTGTALAALMLASGYAKDPGDAILNVRQEYNRRAIETKQQELYVWKLVVPEDKIPMSKIFPPATTPTSLPSQSSSRNYSSVEEDLPDSWYKWNPTPNRK